MAKTPRSPYGGSNVPSQAPSRRVPYSPSIQPDMEVTENMRGVKPIGFPPAGSFAVATYDARLPQAIDFSKPFRAAEGFRTEIDGSTNAITLARTAEFAITVPPSSTMVLKEFFFAVDFPNNPDETFGLVDQWGFPAQSLITADARFSLLVNGSPVPEWGDLPIPFMLTSPVHFSNYVLVPGGQDFVFQFRITTQTDITDNFVVYGMFYGNYLLSKGTSLINEPVNTEALPIRYGGVDGKGSLGIRGTKE